MKGGVEGRRDGGGSDEVLLFVVCTMRGGLWEGLEKVGVPHKKCVFFFSSPPSFLQGKRNARRDDKAPLHSCPCLPRYILLP